MPEMRIVSLLPSATEILFALGLGDQVVGVSHECDYPEEARSKTVVVHSRIPKDIPRLKLIDSSANLPNAARAFMA